MYPCLQALFDHEPENSDELAFEEGDLVLFVDATDAVDDGFWFGRVLQSADTARQVASHCGFFPQMMVELLEQHEWHTLGLRVELVAPIYTQLLDAHTRALAKKPTFNGMPELWGRVAGIRYAIMGWLR